MECLILNHNYKLPAILLDEESVLGKPTVFLSLIQDEKFLERINDLVTVKPALQLLVEHH